MYNGLFINSLDSLGVTQLKRYSIDLIEISQNQLKY